MKTKLTLLTALAGLLVTPALAQETPGARPEGGRGSGGRPQPSAEDVKKYDKDGNGELSREEMRAMFEERRKEMEKKYDANGDGTLDETERKKMIEENPRMAGRGGPGGPGGQPPTAEEIKTHDKNADGKLEGEEVTALREARRKAREAKYDADKDGKLSDDERKKMEDDLRAQFGGRGGRPRGGDAPGGKSKPEEKKAPAAETN